MLGFETIGNATLIAYDGVPILATDPWISGQAYFGSWGHSHQIPTAQSEAVKRCKFLWFSHAHQDHLNLASANDLAHSQFLLADHYGSRIANDLKGLGFSVRILPERKWEQLSDNVKVMTISDANQDSILLVDVGGVLILNFNDAGDHGWGRFVRAIAKTYKTVFLMMLWGQGGTDFDNWFTEDGKRTSSPSDYNSLPLGPTIQNDAKSWGATYAVPFSSFHRFCREDAAWANPYCCPHDLYYQGASPDGPEILPAFLRYDVSSKQFSTLDPPKIEDVFVTAADCGDNWSDRLDADDAKNLQRYFQSKELLGDFLGFLRFRVGGAEHVIDINKQKFSTGVTFEAPRQSLMDAVNNRVFDDMLLGNFMKGTQHGKFRFNRRFTPYVAKVADNGLAESRAEVRAYHRHYFQRDPIAQVLFKLETDTESLVRKYLPRETKAFQVAKRVYRSFK